MRVGRSNAGASFTAQADNNPWGTAPRQPGPWG